jgi:hypothetical protein
MVICANAYPGGGLDKILNNIESLLKAGVDPNVRDRDQSTPLPENIEVFKLLLDYGMVPIYEGTEMIFYKPHPNPYPNKWNSYRPKSYPDNWDLYIKTIENHQPLDVVKGALD